MLHRKVSNFYAIIKWKFFFLHVSKTKVTNELKVEESRGHSNEIHT